MWHVGLVPPPGIEPIPPAVEVWSLNYWIAWEVPSLPFCTHLLVPSRAYSAPATPTHSP